MLLVLHLPFAPLRADARGQARLQRALLPASRHDRDFAVGPPAPTRKLRFRVGKGTPLRGESARAKPAHSHLWSWWAFAVVLGWWRLRRPHPREFDLRLDGFASSNLRSSVLLVNARSAERSGPEPKTRRSPA